MAKIGTRSKKPSGVLAFEYGPEYGYCRETVTVTLQAGMDVGNVLTLVAGKYIWVQQSNHAAATSVAILLGGTDNDIPSLAAVPGDYQLAVLIRGPAGITDFGATFKDALSGAEQLVVQGKFKAQGIVTRKAV